MFALPCLIVKFCQMLLIFDQPYPLLKVKKVVDKLEDERDFSRTIVHVDMDAFYAAVEMRDDPSLRNVPMASTSNYAARKFGVRAAMPGFIARKLCPQLVIVPCNFEKYRKVSEEIRNVLAEYDPKFCPVSLDEAYLDLTDYMEARKYMQKVFYERKRYCGVEEGACVCFLPHVELKEMNSAIDHFPVFEEKCDSCHLKKRVVVDSISFSSSVEDVVKELRFKIEQKTGLTASAGIASNSLLAKICSDKNKPNGQFYLAPDYKIIMNFVRELPVRKIPGIGCVTESLLKAMKITTCQDLFEQRAKISLLHSASSTMFLLRASLGIGDAFVQNGERKSVGVERTFTEKSRYEDLEQMCEDLCRSLAEDLASLGISGRTVTLKYKTVDFDVKTKASSLDRFICSFEDIFYEANKLLKAETAEGRRELKLRLMGVRLTNLFSSSLLKKNLEAWKTDNSETNCKMDAKITCERKMLLENDVAKFSCPVCGHRIPGLESEAWMERHVDGCLNRQAIGQLLSEDKQVEVKRKKISPVKNSRSKLRKIDSYFGTK